MHFRFLKSRINKLMTQINMGLFVFVFYRGDVTDHSNPQVSDKPNATGWSAEQTRGLSLPNNPLYCLFLSELYPTTRLLHGWSNAVKNRQAYFFYFFLPRNGAASLPARKGALRSGTTSDNPDRRRARFRHSPLLMVRAQKDLFWRFSSLLFIFDLLLARSGRSVFLVFCGF